MQPKIFYLRAVTALHNGVGRGSGFVDLPIAREAATGLPMAPGSALKGVLREAMDPSGSAPGKLPDRKEWIALFGPDDPDPEPQAGMLVINDAHLLALPVRSMKGVCAWVTCPFVLRRYVAECKRSGASGLPSVPDCTAGQVLAGETLAHPIGNERQVMLEELDLSCIDNDALTRALAQWAEHLGAAFFPGTQDDDWRKTHFQPRVAIVSDEVFAFLCEMATDVRARVRLNEDRTVKRGALWYEENLPPESLLFGIWGALPVRAAGLEPSEACAKLTAKNPRNLQLGGKASVGRGIVQLFVSS